MTDAEPWIVPQLPDDHDSRILASIDYDRNGVSVVAAVEDGVLDVYVEHDGHEFERQQRLRAAIPGPDTITVNREDVEHVMFRTTDGFDHLASCAHCRRLRAALSEPPAPKEQQPPFGPDLELMANREGNRREVRAYRRDAAPSDVQEQQL